MRHEVQSANPPAEVIDDAARFFTKRRVKVLQRSKSSLQFALPGTATGDAGAVRAARGASGRTSVTVETGGLSVWHVAELYVRDLRKQSRVAGRGRRAPLSANASGGMGATLESLGEALGIPAPAAERPAPRRPAIPPRPRATPPPEPPPTDLSDFVAPPPVEGDDQMTSSD